MYNKYARCKPNDSRIELEKAQESRKISKKTML